MKTVKVICSHRGGIECHDCKHNKAHEVILYDRERVEDFEVHKGYCACAINGGGGDTVACYELC